MQPFNQYHARHITRHALQASPHVETKLVSGVRGAIDDVLLDLRPESASYLSWCAVELTESSCNAVVVPPLVAHGFLTLADHSSLLYQIAGNYVPDAGRGVRWNDTAFAIRWPFDPVVISDRDANYPDLVGI